MILFLLFGIPFAAAAVAFLSGRYAKHFAFLLSLIPLALLVANHGNLIGQQINYPWFDALGIHFHLSIDPLSLVFLYLTAIIIPISFWAVPKKASGGLYGLILLLQGLLIGFFASRDLAFFTLFWEAILIPLYFMISMWGGAKRHQAAMQFILYMIGGSVLLVAAVLALYFASGAQTFDMAILSKAAPQLVWAAAIFVLAFAVKTPLFPFHGWLPDTYTQASTVGTILLSALLSKAGVYGFLRIGFEFFPELLKSWSPILLTLAIIGVFYGGLAAWRQGDFKRMLAYSSFSHVNFILAGIFAWNAMGREGAVVQAFNHAITITGLFLVAKWLENRIQTTEMAPYSGLTKAFPKLSWLTLMFVLSSVALPGTNNFIGELMILFGLFKEQPIYAAILALSIILSVIYMLRWMQNMYFGKLHPEGFSAQDIGIPEFLIALPLVLLILWVGIYPAPLLNAIQGKL